MTASPNIDRRSAIDLLEESVDLLRRAPARAWAGYLAGAVPFWGALLIFWASMTGVTAVPDPLPGALLLALLYGWRQFTRSYFAALLYEVLAGVPAPAPRFRGFVLAWFAGSLRVPLLLFPVPAVVAFFRNISVMALRDDGTSTIFGRAAALAGKGGDQLGALLTLIPAAFLVWVNVFTGMIAMPLLLQIFTGRQTLLTKNIGALMNGSTMLASLMVAWSIVDVTLASFYTLRVYYGEAEDTGADLLGNWRRAAMKTVVAALIVMCCVPLVRAQANPRDRSLDRAIDQVLEQKPYQWRKPLAVSDRQNAFVAWTDTVLDSMRRTANAIEEQWARFKAWLRGRQPDFGNRNRNTPPPVFTLRIASWLVIVVLAGALIALLLRSKVLRTRKEPAVPLPALSPVDLADPSLLASQLPDNEWLTLARDWMAKGDYRMALRAYFLANLAYLGSRELLAVSRSKSNLDYLADVRRRARLLSGMESLFAANIRSFETAWYGLHPVEGEDLNAFASNLERMRTIAG